MIEKKWENHSGNINILKDVTTSDIPKIIAEENIHTIQFYKFQTPKKQTWKVLNEFYGEYPEVKLRVCWNECQNLSFYKEIPNLRRFNIASFHTKDYSSLLSNINLTHLGIEETKSKTVALSFIKAFKNLESLYIDGMKKGLENVQHLKKLKKITFRAIKMDDVSCLKTLENLEELNLFYGSYKNLAALSSLQQLKSISFSRVRQIPNFIFLNSLKNLEQIKFEGMSQMKEVPNLSNLKKLKSIHLRNNLRLSDIKNIEKIPALKLLQIFFPENIKASERRKLVAQSVKILRNSQTIRYTNIMHWTDEATSKEIFEKGIKKWDWKEQLE
ncbi:hypothetical protein [Tenacibaculum maritimum]|uniref:hypothetical protein n=1 Tax=Tenacibaculum maritimum TaxID=107401 RepID=UPI001E3075F4|nr:hypothetical protein [Tenacibaculum maritimum]MCD9583816.1 hypothetical protein [Tenacibaculum maritimum]MCD9611645.1 hypothetical protein [Tenacibaculum maritimum]MCD9619544.1 hypothetical protein [Tenacibaculum maritimum]MCD9628057.1 hypothetical protein [Tenacibaculum maritimum]MCD9630902.1 hypothetical protein [Tenacibaculum maritimum]